MVAHGRPNGSPIVWLGQSVDTSSICSAYPELSRGPFLTSLGCGIRKPNLRKTFFNPMLRKRLGITGPLMVDSGGFVLMTNPKLKWTLTDVSECVGMIDADIFVSLDYPPSFKDTVRERRDKISASVRNYAALAEAFPDKVIMPVVHGRTLAEIELSAQLIAERNEKPDWLGLGGIVPLLQNRSVSKDISKIGPELFIARSLSLMRRVFPEAKIHAFGAGGTRTFPALYAFGADSADSIGWRQAAGFGSIFLPLKSQRAVSWNKARRAPRKVMDRSDFLQLEKCGCPSCKVETTNSRRMKKFRSSFHHRSLHNAWTIINQTSSWPDTREKMKFAMKAGLLGQKWANAAEYPHRD